MSEVSEQQIAIERAIAMLSAGPILLYDGECGVCASSVEWVLAHERQHSLRFAALQSEVGRALCNATATGEVDSLLWVRARTNGSLEASTYSTSVVRVLGYVGGPWRALAVLLAFVPRPLRDWSYRLFARHRQNFAPSRCLLPRPEEHARFVEKLELAETKSRD